MTNAEMHPIQVQHTPMLLQPSLSPRVKLVAQALVEPTDRDFHWVQLPAAFEPLLPRMSRAGSCDKHLREADRAMCGS